MKKNLALAAALALFSALATAQTVLPVRFEHGTEIFPLNFDEASRTAAIAPGELVKGHFVRYVQLEKVMGAEERRAFEASGPKVMGYVHYGAYLVAFPQGYDLKQLGRFGARSIVAPKPDWKWARTLREQPYGRWAVRGDYVYVNVQVLPLLSIAEGAELCRRHGFDVVAEGRMNGYLEVLVHQEKLGELAALPFVHHIELMPPPAEKEDTRGRSLHRSNLLASESPIGRQYDGSGVGVLVRDDGQLGPHIDLQGRLYSYALGSPTSGTHGDGVGGIVGGAGNLNPGQKGMAAGADIFDSDYEASFQDNTTLYLMANSSVRITNSSYSNGCNAGYTLAAQTVDQQIYDNPALMHVFSGGNSNGSNCGYGAGNQWGNITGGHKMAKNAIATANIFADASLVESSSRGPAHDGRLKPDIAANGQDQGSLNPNNGYQVFGGTSGAAPGIAGCLAQLTQAYRAIRNEGEAPAALLKAAILNTANDLGNPGPDYKFGWGHINAWRALRLLEQNNWLQGSIDQGAENTHTLAIPSNVREAKIMVYWADPPATVGTSKALVNDLDLTVYSAAGAASLPWLLDPTPNPATLDAPAGKGRDSLNNVEQVQILNPAAGLYYIRVRGTEVPSGPQQYYIVWEFLRDEIRVTYPAGGEGFAPGEVERIHWDAYENTGNFTLRYSTDGGETFFPLTNVGGDRRMYDWTVPNTVSGKVHVLVIRGSRRDTTDIPCSIVPVPQNMGVEKVCLDSMWVTCDKINDTLSYDAYLLGQKYMELTGTSNSNIVGFPIQNPGKEKWYSMRASHPSGVAGRRAVARRWQGGLLNCPQEYDLHASQLLSPNGAIVSCGSAEVPVAVKITNEGLNPATGATAHYQINNGPPVAETLPDIPAGATISYTFSTPANLATSGDLNLKVWVVFAGDKVDFNDTLSIQVPILAETANGSFVETFEAQPDFPSGWAVLNPDNQKTWVTTDGLPIPVVGPNDIIGRSAHLDFFNYGPNLEGQEDYLFMLPADLAGMDNPTLVFSVAYARYNAQYFDGLRVEVFPDCNLEATPTVIWEKNNSSLATVSDQTTYFYPSSASQWRGESASLNDFADKKVVIRFVSVNGYGNSLYLDNIGVEDVKPPEAFFAVPDTLCRLAPWDFVAKPVTANPSYAWLFGAGANPSSATGAGPHSVTYLTAGNKNIRLIVRNDLGADTLVRTINVRQLATANFTAMQDLLTASFTNTSTNADSYLWDFGDQTGSTEVNPVHTYAVPGTYTVTLSATNACRTHDKTLTIGVTSVSELAEALGLTISPNPNQGQFTLTLDSRVSGKAVTRLYDQSGRTLDERTLALREGVRQTVTYDEAKLPKGAYQLRIQVGERQAVYTIIVQ